MARKRNKLNIKCTDTDCPAGLHCFRAAEGAAGQHPAGGCRTCGIQLVDWERIHFRHSHDVQNTFAMLKLEKVRHFFWHIPLTERAINHAKRKGRIGLRERVKSHLATSIGPSHPWHDGFQTPMAIDSPTAIPYGQHATATCCRKCLEYWHGIPKGQTLDDENLTYLAELLCMYLEDRIPDLTDAGEAIPPIRRTR